VTIYDPTTDNGMRKISDTRKAVLTLGHLNRLKKIRAVNNLERSQKRELVSIMYAPPAEDSEAGGF
jgi:hypothetical protein